MEGFNIGQQNAKKIINMGVCKWADADTCLPNDFEAVLVYTLHGNITVGNLCYGKTRWNLNSEDTFGLNFITHWMPLPGAAPPRQST